jgi:putative membrane protein
MFKKILLNIIIGSFTIYLATLFIPGVYLETNLDLFEKIKIFLIAGLVLGILNYFLKPLLKFFTFPIIILTIGLFNLVINFFIIWLVDILIPQLYIIGFLPTLYTTILFTLLTIFIK